MWLRAQIEMFVIHSLFFLVICYRQSPSEFQGSELYKCFPQEKKTLTVQPIEFQTNLRTKDIFLRKKYIFHIFIISSFLSYKLSCPIFTASFINKTYHLFTISKIGTSTLRCLGSDFCSVTKG